MSEQVREERARGVCRQLDHTGIGDGKMELESCGKQASPDRIVRVRTNTTLDAAMSLYNRIRRENTRVIQMTSPEARRLRTVSRVGSLDVSRRQ